MGAICVFKVVGVLYEVKFGCCKVTFWVCEVLGEILWVGMEILLVGIEILGMIVVVGI